MTEEEKERLGRAAKWSVATICVGFLVGCLFGTLMGVADPNGGWAAWRVGVFAGSIVAGVMLILSMIVTLVYMAEG